MAAIIQTQRISKSYGTDALFVDLDLSFSPGDRVGIVGPNGSGKSSLLKILAGLEEPDEGNLVQSKRVRVAYVPQIETFDPDLTVFDCLMHAAQKGNLPSTERDALVHSTLGRTGFKDPSQKTGVLSGGWIKRLNLACGFVQDAELLLMDEPTNHLDIEGILWLQELLATSDFAWVTVSHDRYFLDQTVQSVMELNSVFADGYLQYQGSYTNFLTQRQRYLSEQLQQIEVLKGKVRRETEWLSRSPKARTTKAQFRVNAAKAMIRELDELKAMTRETQSHISFSASGRATKKLLEAKSIARRYADLTVIRSCSVLLSPRKRLGVLGLNGSGKSTLLKMLADVDQPDGGTIQRAPHLKTVYFDQKRAQINPDDSVARALSETGDQVLFQGRSVHIVSWAKRFGIEPDQLPLPVRELSGGERAKVLIARLMLQTADVLILDEPTNDLDIPTIEQLEKSLMAFEGALVLVSHDRFMMSRVCSTFLGLDGRGGVQTYASYEQWESTLEPEKPNAKVKSEKSTSNEKAPKKRLSYLEQREFDGMEEQILESEDRQDELRNQIEDPDIASNGTKLAELYEDLKKAEAKTAKLYERWAELEAKVSQE